MADIDVVRELREHPIRSAWGARVAEAAAAEIDGLRARLAAVEAERDSRHELAGQATVEVLNLRARVRKAEARVLVVAAEAQGATCDLVAAEEKLAAIESLCDEMTGFCCDAAADWAADIRAAAHGEVGRG